MSHETRWTAQKIAARLRLIVPRRYTRSIDLPPFRYKPLPGPEAPDFAAPGVDDDGWQELPPGAFWGQPQIDFVMRSRFRAPADWDPAQPTDLLLPIGEAPDFIHPEALIFVDGAPFAAVDRFHQELRLPPRWLDGEEHLLALRGYSGVWISNQSGGSTPFRLHMGRPRLAQIHEPTHAFLVTARVALETVQALDADHPARWVLLNALDDAFRRLDTREPLGDAFYASVPRAHATLQEGIAAAGPPHEATIAAAGHAHLDLAWLWTLAQGRRKAERTWHNAVRLMEQFPAYHFTQSQPQLYDDIRRDHPALFRQVQDLVKKRRWEPLGGMWVEADCNLSGPESLARQFLLGQRFLRRHFGDDVSPVLWLPDVFGYAWNLPQLIKQAGLDYFFTIKIGWSQYNRLPYDTFWWRGLDGTRVLTHFSTTPEPSGEFRSHGTYNAVLSPRFALETWRNFQQKEAQQELLMSFGYGDGGGGPNREMLENMELLADFPAVPRLRPGRVVDFFRRLEAQSGDRLPTWNGELYLELHRGTYTSQARNKRANRKSEFLLHDAEFLATLAAQLDPAYDYPRQALDEAWRLVCLNQFHDIIPGSSIRQVYVDSLQQYEEVRHSGETIRDDALQIIARRLDAPWIVANPTSFTRHDLAFYPSGSAGILPASETQLIDRPEHMPGSRTAQAQPKGLQQPGGAPIRTQQVRDGTLLDFGPLPPYSVTPLQATAETPSAPPTEQTASAWSAEGGVLILENGHVRVRFDPSGDITRIYDKAHRCEIMPAGASANARANAFQAFEDRPLNWDAWDVDIFYDDRTWLAEPAGEIRVVENGPLRATIEIHRRILDSPIVQRISLDYNSPQITFDTRIDWRQRHTLLKVAFPVNVLSPQASFEIQWGHVQRPTHRNTSWDWARFETCAQKWVDLSEGDYGVSLLNDGKYGHDIRDNVLRLTLLRSPTHPDPEADQGSHHFTYALLPHAGPLGEDTIRAAYTLNDPLLVVAAQPPTATDPAVPSGTAKLSSGQPASSRSRGPTAQLPAGQPLTLITTDRSDVIIETVKQAQDSGDGAKGDDAKGDIIIRLYEALRRRGPLTLTCALPLRTAYVTNLLEENQKELEIIDDHHLTFDITPFQILTLRLVPHAADTIEPNV